MINYDCVSDGDNILVGISKKANQKYHVPLSRAFTATEEKTTMLENLKKVYYPSDQAGFPVAIAVAALKYKKPFGYYMDKIQWSTNSAGQWTPTNIGKALYFGSDNSLSTDLPTFVQFGLDYHFVLTYLLGYGLSLEDNRRIMYTPVHSLSFHVDFSWKTGLISLIGKYTSERFTSNLNISSLAPYFTFDVSFEQNIGKYFTVFAAVKNMLNAYYFETEGYPMPGGSVTVGVRVQAGGDWKKTE